jgi:hypothetical protein
MSVWTIQHRPKFHRIEGRSFSYVSSLARCANAAVGNQKRRARVGELLRLPRPISNPRVYSDVHVNRDQQEVNGISEVRVQNIRKLASMHFAPTFDLCPPRGSLGTVSTPVRAVEAWIVAALFPKEPAPEGIHDPAEFLVAKKKLRRSPKNNKPWKELHLYRGFSEVVAKKTKQVAKTCVETKRTMVAIERQRRAREIL